MHADLFVSVLVVRRSSLWNLQPAHQHHLSCRFDSQLFRSVAAHFVAEQRATFQPPLDSVDFEEVRRQVQGPAIGLIVAGILSLLPLPLALLAIAWSVVGGEGVGGPGVAEVLIVFLIAGLSLPFGVVMVIGGLKMRKLEAHGLAFTASILALLPGTLGCIVALPIGIWSLIVLNRAEVKAAFTRQRNDLGEPPPPRKPLAAGDDLLSDHERWRVQSMIRGPATGLMLVGLLNLLPLVLTILWVPISTDTVRPVPAMATWPIDQATMLLAQVGPYAEQPVEIMRPNLFWAALVTLLVGLPLSGLLILGGWKMRRLRLFWLAVIVSVVAILPCHLGFIIGLPVGLWSLAVLSRSDVKTVFRQHAAGQLEMLESGF